MKKLLAAMLLLIASACTKNSVSVEGVVPDPPVVQSKPVILGNSTLVVNGSLDLQTTKVNVASLGLINYRSSYQLCGTAGSNLLWPVILPLADSATYSSNILMEGDSLSAEVVLDTTYNKSYNNITLTIFENEITVNSQSVFGKTSLKRMFEFHNGSKYQFIATVK